MRIKEEILWILDAGSTGLKDDALYEANIAFSRSLGLKCDCVGWTKDVGKLQAPQYFTAWPDRLLDRIGTDERIKKQDPEPVAAFPTLSQFISEALSGL